MIIHKINTIYDRDTIDNTRFTMLLTITIAIDIHLIPDKKQKRKTTVDELGMNAIMKLLDISIDIYRFDLVTFPHSH